MAGRRIYSIIVFVSLALGWLAFKPPVQTPQVLAGAVPLAPLTDGQRAALRKARNEYIGVQQLNADRPEVHLNLGLLYARRGEFNKAEAAYRAAYRLHPGYTAAYVKLADLYREQGKADAGERVLRQAMKLVPDDAAVHHALGLLLIRQKRLTEALDALAQAARSGPDNPRYGYVYAAALIADGKRQPAIQMLEQTHTRHPNDRDVLLALVIFNRDTGNLQAANTYRQKLIALSQQYPALDGLLGQLKNQ